MPRLALVVAVLVLVLGGGWLWLRDSSLVAVEHVSVTGDSGPDAGQIRTALTAAARTMSTLDVNMGQLRSAIEPYPAVRDIRVSTQFPHGMRIRLVEQIPVAAVEFGGRLVPVAADGTLLHDAGPTPSLPAIQLRSAPGGPRLTEPDAVSAVALLAAAPYQMLAKISQVMHDATHGLTAQVRGGPVIYFGDATELAAKWMAATEVLADPGSIGATYIDVTDPQRPAAGAGSAAVAAAGLDSAAAQSSSVGASGTSGSSATSASSGTSADSAATGSSSGTAGSGTAAGATGATSSGASGTSSGAAGGTGAGPSGTGSTSAATGSTGSPGG